MTHLHIHRTWPCGFQESMKARGWLLSFKMKDEDTKRPCPVHGESCSRSVGNGR